MSSPWPVPGYTPVESLAGPVGRAGGAEAWRARCLRDGATVLVRLLDGVDDDGLHRLRAHAAVLGALAHPHLLAVRDVVRAGDRVAVVTDAPTGRWLPDLLPRTGGLSSGAVVTLLAPLAEAVAAMHGRGLAHGDISADTVIVTLDGRPLLDVAVHDRTTHRYDDVRALARLGLRAFGDSAGAPPALVDALRRADTDDPDRRPTATALAADLLRACPASPLPGPTRSVVSRDVGGAPPQPASDPAPPPRRRGAAAVSLRVGAAVAGLALAVGAGTAWGHAGSTGEAAAAPTLSPRPASTAPRPAPRPRPDWVEVVAALERRRAAAMRAGDVAGLRRVYLPGSPAVRRDVRLLRDLAARGLRVRGLHPSVAEVTVLRAGAQRAVVRVTDTLSAVRVVDANGRVVQRRPPRSAATVRLILVGRDGQWVIGRVGQPTSARSAASTSS